MIVVDNGRSRIRGSDEGEILNCIRCGSCLTVCPVYSKVGGHAYGSVYGGPIGAVLTPLLTGMQPDEGRKLPFLSSLCGACTDACPVGIPLHDLLVRDRALANRAGAGLAQRARRLGRAGRAPGRARACTAPRRGPAPAPGPFARAFGPGASWLEGRATLPLPSTKPFHRRWARPGRRRVIDAFIAAVEADGGQAARVPTPPPRAATSPGCSDATRRSASGGRPARDVARPRLARPRHRARPGRSPASPARTSASRRRARSS